MASIPGYRNLAMPGSQNVYRRIAANPTVALMYAATRAMMKTPGWSVEADDDVPDEVIKYVEDAFIRPKAGTINHATTALIFGRSTFEKVWSVKDGRLVPKLKPLVADVTTPMVDRDTGAFVGVKNEQTGGHDDNFLGLTKCWHFAYDGEAGDPWGRSRLENIRCTAWRSWDDIATKQAQYTTKAAGVIPVANMPLGSGEDGDGSTKSNQEIAETLLRELGGGKGVVMPNQYSHEIGELLATNPKLAELLMWRISFLEVPSGHGAEFIDMLKAEETRMARGFLWPERALLEGQFGTKAEAGTHQDIGITICEQDLAEMVEDFNRDVVDDGLAANWGTLYIGKVRVKVAPMRDTEREFFRSMMRDLLLNPVAMDVAAQLIDVDAHLDQAGFTKAEEVVQAGKPLVGKPDDPEPPEPPEDEPEPDDEEKPIQASRDAIPSVQATPEQRRTVAGMLSAPIKWLRGGR